MQVAPDFEYTKPQADTSLLFVHRKLADGEVYWVDNRSNRTETLEATFRVHGQSRRALARRYRRIEPASYQIAGGRTTVPLRLEPNDAVFVVFRKAAAAPSRTAAETRSKRTLATRGRLRGTSLSSPTAARPPKITLDRLSFLGENADTGVKYFSGTGTYTKTIQAPADWFKSGAQLWLDLGDVKNLARGHGQRQAARHPLEDAVPGGCDRRAEARRQCG